MRNMLSRFDQNDLIFVSMYKEQTIVLVRLGRVPLTEFLQSEGYHHVVPYHVVGIRGCRETTYSYTTDERYEETGYGLSGNTCGF